MIAVCLLGLLLVWLVHELWWKRRGLPPGPIPLPFIGNGVQLSQFSSGEKALLAWRRRYGDTFTFWMGNRPNVVVCDYDSMLEHFVREPYNNADRPDNRRVHELMRDGLGGVVNVNGDFWRRQRRFVLKTFRDFGVGKAVMEQKVLLECQTMLDYLDEELDQHPASQQLCAHVDRAAASVISSLMFGFRFEKHNWKEFDDLKNATLNLLDALGQPPVLMAWENPQAYANLPGFRTQIRRVRTEGMKMTSFLVPRCQKLAHELSQLSEEEMRDFEPTDLAAAFLKEAARLGERAAEEHFTVEQLCLLMFDVWVAGQETTSGTIQWGLAYLLNHPDVMCRVQAELDKVVGSQRLVNMSDRPELPYFNAVCNEVQRLANLLPFNLMHATAGDTVIDGYHIPAGTALMPGISVLMYDEKYFPEPMAFKPERFLDEDGKLKRVDQLMPFSLGKRQCLGEGIARMELFLVLANLLHRYRLIPVGGPPDLAREHGFTVHSKPFQCRLERRQTA